MRYLRMHLLTLSKYYYSDGDYIPRKFHGIHLTENWITQRYVQCPFQMGIKNFSTRSSLSTARKQRVST